MSGLPAFKCGVTACWGLPGSAHLAGQLSGLHPDLALHAAEEQAFDPAGSQALSSKHWTDGNVL